MENVNFCILVALLVEIQVAFACEDGSSNDSCWYTFWYVWVALGLFITVLITMVIVYYKHKWSKRRTRVRRIAVVQPQNPPPYDAPSQLPPSYEDSLKHTVAINIPGYNMIDTRPVISRGHRLINVHSATQQHSRQTHSRDARQVQSRDARQVQSRDARQGQSREAREVQSRESLFSMPPNYDHATSSRS
ncbi:uncharacterized protein LOC133202193 [Saccostrea echinata]|uniref:uncharacterized protein LOC133202193 n=1 Tax=Saccostrea echinata TaxID=191078 RepID=UPI002A8222BC|nr:uncharacterized protein LOC133202193 [Saccostrea echinata]